jgi:hypothetical protein
VLLTGVVVASWKIWPAVENCLLKFSIIVDLSVAAGRRCSYSTWALLCVFVICMSVFESTTGTTTCTITCTACTRGHFDCVEMSFQIN